MIAPFWADIDFRGSESIGTTYSLHYHTQTDATSIKLFNQTSTFIREINSTISFKPTAILLATWLKGPPYYYGYYTGTNHVGIFFINSSCR